MQRYGVPLDSRTQLTKTDWSLWSATLAENQADFEALVSPIYDYLNETTARDPLADSYETDKVQSGGMHARPVVGGVFIKMLADRALWKKWARRDRDKVGDWAPLPQPPQVTEVVPTSQTRPGNLELHHRQTRRRLDQARFRRQPLEGRSRRLRHPRHARRRRSNPVEHRRHLAAARVHPARRRTFSHLQFDVYHDEDVEIYVNGVLAASEAGFTTGYVALDITPRGAGPAQTRRQSHPGRSLPPDGRRTEHRCRPGRCGGEFRESLTRKRKAAFITL